MARLFEPFQAPRPQRTKIDPMELARILAAPAVAREEGRTQLFQTLADMPSKLFGAYQTGQEIRSKRELTELQKAQLGLEGKKTEADIAFTAAKIKALGDQKGTPYIDPTTGEVKFYAPKGSKIVTETPSQKDTRKADTFKNEAFDLLNTAKSILSKVPAGAIKGGFQRAGAASGQFGTAEASQYQALKPSIATKIYRGFTGDTRLSDADAAARALPLLPDITDTQAIREAKFAVMDQIFSGGMDSNAELDILIKLAPAPLAAKARAAKAKGLDSGTITGALKKDLGQ